MLTCMHTTPYTNTAAIMLAVGSIDFGSILLISDRLCFGSVMLRIDSMFRVHSIGYRLSAIGTIPYLSVFLSILSGSRYVGSTVL
jgi:hypothetical protein